jgi:hypothetical protein
VKKGQSRFDIVLVEAVQEGLDSISPSVSNVVLFHLRKQSSIPCDEQCIDPEALDCGLRQIFGCGATVIEKKILEQLYQKLEAPHRVDGDFRFAEEVKKAKRRSSQVRLGPLEAEVTP